MENKYYVKCKYIIDTYFRPFVCRGVELGENPVKEDVLIEELEDGRTYKMANPSHYYYYKIDERGHMLETYNIDQAMLFDSEEDANECIKKHSPEGWYEVLKK